MWYGPKIKDFAKTFFPFAPLCDFLAERKLKDTPFSQRSLYTVVYKRAES
jgi:hypothetical protein